MTRKAKTAAQLDREIEDALARTREIMLLKDVIRGAKIIHGEGRFGDRKVFVAALHDWLDDDRMTLAQFKRWLVDQHRARKLVLARADLVAAMPYEMVRRSEIDADGTTTFHFVVDPSVR